MLELINLQNPRWPAILDSATGTVVEYGDLAERVAAAAEFIRGYEKRPLALHVCTNTIDSIVLYLACLEAGVPLCLLEPFGANSPDRIIETFRPDLILLPPGAALPGAVKEEQLFPGTNYRLCRLGSNGRATSLHSELALLLTTSGSTGAPKLVRLALRNVLANARSIVSYLGVNPDERAIQSLPMHYSYGLSIVNSHLLAGGTIVATSQSFFNAEFWNIFDRFACSSFAGVPYMYDALHRVQFDPARHTSLRTMTQAGGGLRRDLIRAFHERAIAAGARFYVMYGQTEATARIAYVPPERLGDKIGSIGIPIPGGRMEMAEVDGFEFRELIYSGPNVMMGYAESAADLACGDELHGVLRTGDLVERDSDGFFYLRGRLKRFAKILGRRISLSDVENDVEVAFAVRAAAIEDRQTVKVFVETDGGSNLAAISAHIARFLRVPPKFASAVSIGVIPLTASGKKDYQALSS